MNKVTSIQVMFLCHNSIMTFIKCKIHILLDWIPCCSAIFFHLCWSLALCQYQTIYNFHRVLILMQTWNKPYQHRISNTKWTRSQSYIEFPNPTTHTIKIKPTKALMINELSNRQQYSFSSPNECKHRQWFEVDSGQTLRVVRYFLRKWSLAMSIARWSSLISINWLF